MVHPTSWEDRFGRKSQRKDQCNHHHPPSFPEAWANLGQQGHKGFPWLLPVLTPGGGRFNLWGPQLPRLYIGNSTWL